VSSKTSDCFISSSLQTQKVDLIRGSSLDTTTRRKSLIVSAKGH
jgi:hypothetical protein